MTLQRTRGALIGNPIMWRAAFDTVAMAASTKHAQIIQVPKTGSITKVGFRTGTVTTPQTLKVTIQTMSGGNPSGSLYGGSAAGTQTSPAASTYYEVTLGTPATAVQGDYIAIVIEWNATAGSLQIASGTGWFNQNFPYTDFFNVSWAHTGNLPIGHLGYSDGTYELAQQIPVSAFTTVTYGSTSTPDERALKFKVPFPARVKGATLRLGFLNTSADYKLILYDANNNILSSLSAVAANANGTGNDTFHMTFPTSVAIKANQFYRLALQPNGTNTINLIQIDCNTAALLDAFNGGQQFFLSTRTDAGAWSDTLTSRPGINLEFDQFHDGHQPQYA